jgi:hypothetical protein
VEYNPKFERCPPAVIFSAVAPAIARRRGRVSEGGGFVELPTYEFNCLNGAIVGLSSDMNLIRTAIEWDCVGPGTGPPTRELLLECLQFLGTLNALAMILLSFAMIWQSSAKIEIFLDVLLILLANS